MACFTTAERITMVKLYYELANDYTEMSTRWSLIHKKRAKPGKAIIDSVVSNFEKNGTVKFDFNATLDPITGEMIPAKEIHPSPYLIQTLQHISKPNPRKRLDLAKYLLESEESNTLKLDHIWFTSQATFHIHGYVSRDVYRFWGSSKPEIEKVSPLGDTCVTVWAAMCGKTILGPFFIPHSFTAEDYHDFINHQILNEITYREMDSTGYCWMQDVPDHLKTEKIFYMISARFGDMMLADKSNEMCSYGMDWPNYSPDLNPVDFFIWGYVKDKLDQFRPTTESSLEDNIGTAFDDLRRSSELMMKNVEVLKKRLDLVRKSCGWYFDKTFF